MSAFKNSLANLFTNGVSLLGVNKIKQTIEKTSVTNPIKEASEISDIFNHFFIFRKIILQSYEKN